MAGWFHVLPLNTLRVSSRESMETGITNSEHDQNDQHKMRTRPPDSVHSLPPRRRWNKSAGYGYVQKRCCATEAVLRRMTSDRGRRHDERVWAAFEAEALPHLDRLFRLAMWFERDRDEAEDLVQETL